MSIGLYETEGAMLIVECPDRFHSPFPGVDLEMRNKCQGSCCPMFREKRDALGGLAGYYCGKGGRPL